MVNQLLNNILFKGVVVLMNYFDFNIVSIVLLCVVVVGGLYLVYNFLN